MHSFFLLLVLNDCLAELLGLFFIHADAAEVFCSWLGVPVEFALLLGSIHEVVGFPSLGGVGPLGAREGVEFDARSLV